MPRSTGPSNQAASWPSSAITCPASEYRTIPFPYTDLSASSFTIDVDWSLDHLLGYIGTWSAVKHYQKTKNENPVIQLEPGLRTAWGKAGELPGRFPLLLRIARAQ